MKTLALVIGNNNYSKNAKLENAINDARAISTVFEQLGYDVIFKEDITSNNCSELLSQFEEKINEYDASIFYFAGHGFQFDGENYMASIECPVENPNKHICERTCIRLVEITDIIKKANTKVNIIIIDACRKSFGRGVSNSFAQFDAPEGTIIAFSTSPGEGAKDEGMDGHSIYTGALLKYIGRELLSVEELFKKVRKTVYSLSSGTQTTWEHTSLVGDFYFNTGQMVYSVTIPYDELVVKDRLFISKGDKIDNIIMDLRSCNWDKQNPAMEKFNQLQPDEIDKNRQFIIGRNILQASNHAFGATSFIENLDSKLLKYFEDEDNHILNGMLYEIYFDNNGDFRRDNLKKYHLDKIFALRHNPSYKKSFEFICNVLQPFKDELFYMPTSVDNIIDIDVKVLSKKIKKLFLEELEDVQQVESIIVNGKNITKEISKICNSSGNSLYLKKVLVEYLAAPEELINVIESTEIKKIYFGKER